MAEPVPRIYVDTCVYVDLITKNEEPHKDLNEPRWQSARALFDAVNENRVSLAASALTEAEVCSLPAFRAGTDEVGSRIRGWFLAPGTMYIDVDMFLARKAAELSAEWHEKRASPKRRLGGADATHLAAAVRLGCDYLMTHDEGFPLGHQVEGVQVMRPSIVWPQTLFDGQ